MKQNRMTWEGATRTAGAIRRFRLCGASMAVMLASTGMLPAAGNARTQQHTRREYPKGGEQILVINQHEWLYSKLPSENDIPEFRELIAKGEALPKTTILRPTYRPGSKPVRIAIHEVGPGTNSHVYVLIHGMLASYKTWRYLAGALPGDSDVWLVDLPGHGESDKPSPASLGPGGYAPGAVAERILQALEQQLAARSSAPRMTFIAHSLGGLMVIRMLSCPELRRRHLSCLAQVDEAVPLRSVRCRGRRANRPVAHHRGASSTTLSIGDALGVVHEKVARATKDGCYRDGYATRESADLLFQAFTTPAILAASQAMIKGAVPGWETKRRPDWVQIRPAGVQLYEYYCAVPDCLGRVR